MGEVRGSLNVVIVASPPRRTTPTSAIGPVEARLGQRPLAARLCPRTTYDRRSESASTQEATDRGRGPTGGRPQRPGGAGGAEAARPLRRTGPGHRRVAVQGQDD